MNERVNPELIAAVVEEVIKQLMTTGNVNLPNCASPARSFEGKDISSPEVKAVPLLDRIEVPTPSSV